MLPHGWIVPELVLIVEPDEETAARIVAALHDAGLRTVLCTNPAEAVPVVLNVHPDVIIADFSAASSTGERLLVALRDNGSAIPCIVLHSPNGAQDKVGALWQGADDWLEKPFDVDELVARVGAILRRKRAAWSTVHEQADLYSSSKDAHTTELTAMLTGLYPQVYFHERLAYEVRRAKRYARPLALLILSLDYFREYSAHYGQRARQQALHQVGDLIRRSVRSEDLPARLGKSDFAVVLPEVAPTRARAPAERVRINVRKLHIDHMQQATASVGVSVLLSNDTAQVLLHRAKEAKEASVQRGGDAATVLPEALAY